MTEPIRNDLCPSTNPYLRAVEATWCEDTELAVQLLGDKTTFELDLFLETLVRLQGTVRDVLTAKLKEQNRGKWT